MKPSLEEIEQRADEGTLVPVYLEVMADLETPISAYLKLARGNGSFLLESVEGGRQLGRYSFVGLEPDATITFEKKRVVVEDGGREEDEECVDPLEWLHSYLSKRQPVPVGDLPRFSGGAVGYFSYELAGCIERLPSPAGRGLGLPLGRFGVYGTVLAFDHLHRTIKIITHIETGGDLREAYARARAKLEEIADRLLRETISHDGGISGHAPADRSSNGNPEYTCNLTREQFESGVRRAKEYIAAGDAIQVVLSQRLSTRCDCSALSVYRALRFINPSPYMYLLDMGSFQIVGASPEMLVRVEGGTVSVHPIAGTRPRGQTPADDERLAGELTADEKERAEHFMLVDLGRNDVGRVSEAGSVRVTELMGIERYSHVMHMVSHVEGRLRAGLRPMDALRAAFPAGTVSGAPKVRAMEIVSELEPDERGPYSGAVGYFGFDGNLDTAIALRTVVLAGGTAHVQVGAGIVADSQPSLEFEETLNKARGVLRAVELAQARSHADEEGTETNMAGQGEATASGGQR